MPTVLRSGPYRFFFYSGDRAEPPHVHVESAGQRAKFWLQPVRLEDSAGFRWTELRTLERIVVEHVDVFLGAWHDFFSD